MKKITFRGIRPDDLHGRMGLRNPERGFRTEIYVSEIADEIDALLRQQMSQMTVPAVSDEDIPEMDPEMGDGDEA